jgi:hypothetical protein
LRPRHARDSEAFRSPFSNRRKSIRVLIPAFGNFFCVLCDQSFVGGHIWMTGSSNNMENDMKMSMRACVKAGRLFKLLGWLGIIGGVALTAAMAIPVFLNGSGDSAVIGMMAMEFAFFVVLGVAHLVVGSALNQHKNWARIVGIVYGSVSLIGFPVGTVVGAFLLWWLVKNWDDAAQTAVA